MLRSKIFKTKFLAIQSKEFNLQLSLFTVNKIMMMYKRVNLVYNYLSSYVNWCEMVLMQSSIATKLHTTSTMSMPGFLIFSFIFRLFGQFGLEITIFYINLHHFPLAGCVDGTPLIHATSAGDSVKMCHICLPDTRTRGHLWLLQPALGRYTKALGTALFATNWRRTTDATRSLADWRVTAASPGLDGMIGFCRPQSKQYTLAWQLHQISHIKGLRWDAGTQYIQPQDNEGPYT